MTYTDVETLRDPDGIIAVITQRTDTSDGRGYFSFRLQKEYDRDGTIRYTSHYGRRHIDAIVRLSKRVGDRIDILDEQFKLARAKAANV